MNMFLPQEVLSFIWKGMFLHSGKSNQLCIVFVGFIFLIMICLIIVKTTFISWPLPVLQTFFLLLEKLCLQDSEASSFRYNNQLKVESLIWKFTFSFTK